MGLNKRTVNGAMYVSKLDETLNSLVGARYFSCLDLENGYWQIWVSETAFSVSPLGLY